MFGEGGGERIAANYQTRLLGRLPLSRSIREQADGGQPTVVAEPQGAVAHTYREIATRMAAALARRAAAGVRQGPKISVTG